GGAWIVLNVTRAQEFRRRLEILLIDGSFMADSFDVQISLVPAPDQVGGKLQRGPSSHCRPRPVTLDSRFRGNERSRSASEAIQSHADGTITYATETRAPKSETRSRSPAGSGR